MAQLNGGSNVKGDLSIEGTATVSGNTVHHDGNTPSRGMYDVVTSVNDTDGTTPFDTSLTIANPGNYQTYKLIGYLWGSNYSQGEGGEIDASITLNNITDPIYDYNTLDDANGITNVSDDTAWKETFWRRYKRPINFTISADSDAVTAPDGNDSMFTSINSNGHTSERGLLNGRLGSNWVDGGHPIGQLSSVDISTTDNIEGKLVLYGMDWMSDL